MKKIDVEDTRITRSMTTVNLIVQGKSEILQSTFLSDASRAWNKAPECIRQSESIWKVKKEI